MSHKRLLNTGFLLLILLSSIALPLQAQSGTTLKVLPATTTVAVGGTLEILVNVENVRNLYSVDIPLTFDAGILEVVDADTSKDGIQVAHGGLLSPDYVVENTVTGGAISYVLSQIAPHTAVNGNGTLLKITFRGKANGTSAIAVGDFMLADSNGVEITAAKQAGSITVGSGSSGTTPTATPVTPTGTPKPAATATPTPTRTPYITPTPTPWHTPTATPSNVTPTSTVPPQPTSVVTPVPGGNPCAAIQGYHVLKQNETLFALARAYATQPQTIAQCNGLTNPNRISSGVKLAIPTHCWHPVPAGPTAQRQFTPVACGGGTVPATPAPSSGCRYTHTVTRGETLTHLSVRYNVNFWTIARANAIANPNLIYVGQQLCIP